MKSISRIATGLVTLAFFATMGTLTARADCGLAIPKPSAFLLNPEMGKAEQLLPASMKSVANQSDLDPIVGMWSVSFVSGGTEIDHGISQWHSDGTEFMNSGGLSPATQNFCMGVWKNVNGVYKLNHFALSYDATTGQLNANVNIREHVTLDHSGNNYAGTFTIDVFTPGGVQVAHIEGTITGERITAD